MMQYRHAGGMNTHTRWVKCSKCVQPAQHIATLVELKLQQLHEQHPCQAATHTVWVAALHVQRHCPCWPPNKGLKRLTVNICVATGLRDFNTESVKLAYGEDSPVLANKQVAAVQSLSGTGSCRLFAEFQKRFLPNSSIYIPVVSGGCWDV